MSRTEARQGVRMMKFLSILSRYEASEFSQLEAAELLGMGERTFRRWRQRYEEDGEAGLLDRRLGKISGRRVPVDREAEVEALYRERYGGFTAKHFHEHLVRDHRFGWGYTWTKTFLQSRGLLEQAPRRGAHRRKRPRRPLRGHDVAPGWVAARLARRPAGARPDGHAGRCDERGSTRPSWSTRKAPRRRFRGAGRGVRPSWPACELYTDRGSHYFHTPEAGGKVDRANLTQVGRALGSARHRAHRGLFAAGARPLASGPSAPCRTGCRRSWRWPGSPRSRPPTVSFATSTSPPTTPALR